MASIRKRIAYALFAAGKTATSPEVKALCLKYSTRLYYYAKWKAMGSPSVPVLDGKEALERAIIRAIAIQGDKQAKIAKATKKGGGMSGEDKQERLRDLVEKHVVAKSKVKTLNYESRFSKVPSTVNTLQELRECERRESGAFEAVMHAEYERDRIDKEIKELIGIPGVWINLGTTKVCVREYCGPESDMISVKRWKNEKWVN